VRLERALYATLIIHALAMVAMAALLLPGMPGGGQLDPAVRVQYIAAHPWLWRLGWLPWQLTALSDLVLAVALLRTPWIPRLPAVVTAALTAIAVVPDQLGQLSWITQGVALAQRDPAAYLAYEPGIFRQIGAWATILYTLGAVGWTWCFAAGRTWSRALTVLSILLWPLFMVVSVGPLVGLAPKLVAAGNAIGFVALELWLALVIEQVLRRKQPATPHGQWAPWRHPRLRWLDPLAESRFLHAAGGLLPSVSLRSDIRDVVYVNYIVEAERLLPLVPPGLELERLGPDGKLAVFSFLTFRHGGFGPGLLGGLRRLLPSPLQSNWRIHVRHPGRGLRGVHFLGTAITATPQALLARWLVHGVPMHVLADAELARDGDEVRLRLEPGRGSAPDALASLRPAATPVDGPWRACFTTWRDLLAYVVPQDRVLVTGPDRAELCRLEIDLGIPLEACEPLEGTVVSRAADAITGGARPFSFRVPSVSFWFREARWESAGAG
jgi:hypothetical protein